MGPARDRRRRPGGVVRAPIAALLTAVLLVPRSVQAASLPGAELEIVRSPRATSCPNEEATAASLRARIPRVHEQGNTREPLLLHVRIDADDSGYFATVHASGRNDGVRTLLAEGPGCAALQDALLLSLLLLLDAEPTAPNLPPIAPAVVEPAPAGPPLGAPRGTWSPWIGAGVAATSGLPDGLGVAPFVEATVGWPRGEITLGAFWAPERRVAFGQGEVHLQSKGLRVVGCWELLRRGEFRWDACGVGQGADLAARASGFTESTPQHRPWWAAGIGSDLRWAPTAGVEMGLSLNLLRTLHYESFRIDPLGQAYQTGPLLGWLAASVRMKIW